MVGMNGVRKDGQEFLGFANQMGKRGRLLLLHHFYIPPTSLLLKTESNLFYSNLAHNSRKNSGCQGWWASFSYGLCQRHPNHLKNHPQHMCVLFAFNSKVASRKPRFGPQRRNHYISNNTRDKEKMQWKHCLAPFCPYLCKSGQSQVPL